MVEMELRVTLAEVVGGRGRMLHGRAGKIHHPAGTPFLHAGKTLLGQMQRRDHVDLQGLAHVLEGLLIGRLIATPGGVVDEDVDAAEFGDGLRNDIAALFFLGQICADANAFAAMT